MGSEMCIRDRNDSDPEGDALTLTISSPPAAGTATVVDGGIQFTPAAGSTETGVIGYTISDVNGGEATATLTVTVTVTAANNNQNETNSRFDPTVLPIPENGVYHGVSTIFHDTPNRFTFANRLEAVADFEQSVYETIQIQNVSSLTVNSIAGITS